MTKLILIFVFLMQPAIGFACISNPHQSVAANYKEVMAKSDAVFLARFDSEKVQDSIQQAEFTVIKTFKGTDTKRIRVTNFLSHSCARAFTDINGAYYLFLKKSRGTDHFIIERHATFLSMSDAIRFDLGLR